MNQVTETDRRLVRRACDVERGLTEWEVGFVEDVASQVLDRGQELSEKQRAKLDEILARVAR